MRANGEDEKSNHHTVIFQILEDAPNSDGEWHSQEAYDYCYKIAGEMIEFGVEPNQARKWITKVFDAGVLDHQESIDYWEDE